MKPACLRSPSASRSGRRWAVALLGLLLAVSLADCGGPTRSVAAYCAYFYGQGNLLRQHWAHMNQADHQDPFSAFADLPEAANFLHQLSLRAPEEIAPDVQLLADAIGKLPSQAGAAADPLGSLASGLVAGVAAGGAEQRVNEYTERHCGSPES